MENQPKLNSSKEVIAFLAERFPNCFSAEGEARPLKIGIFQDLVERVQGEMGLSKTQLRSALRLYTSSWRYLYGIKAGATRVDLDGNACGVLDEQHVQHARQQLEEAKARVQAQREQQKAAKQAKRVQNPVVRVVRPHASQPKAKRRVKRVLSRRVRPLRIANRLSALQRRRNPSPIPQLCNLARISKSKQAKVRWTPPFSKCQKTAFGYSSLPAWQ